MGDFVSVHMLLPVRYEAKIADRVAELKQEHKTSTRAQWQLLRETPRRCFQACDHAFVTFGSVSLESRGPIAAAGMIRIGCVPGG